MSITVTLNVGNNPPVTCDPGKHHKKKGTKGKVIWERADGSDFTFCALEIAGACFSNLHIEDDLITIFDDNSGNGTVGDYRYTLIVRSADGMNFYSTETAQPVQGGNDPTIRNN